MNAFLALKICMMALFAALIMSNMILVERRDRKSLRNECHFLAQRDQTQLDTDLQCMKSSGKETNSRIWDPHGYLSSSGEHVYIALESKLGLSTKCRLECEKAKAAARESSNSPHLYGDLDIGVIVLPEVGPFQ